MRIAACLLLLAACGNDSATTEDVPSAVTYWQHVEPIFQTNCITCHTDGGIGPFPLDVAETAAQFAPAIVAEVESRAMPPWPPGPDTPALRHVRALTDEQIATIKAWSMGGAEVGDPGKPQPHDPPEVIDIGATELGFDVGLDYVPDTSLTDDYRCFLADIGATELRMATGFKVTPGNRAIVHHVIVTQVAAADRQTLEDLDAETPDRAGWPCVGGAIPGNVDVSQSGNLGSWVPGVSAVAFPEGTGIPIQAGSLAIIQMHYNLLGGADPDRTRVDIALAPREANGTLVRLGGLGLIKRNLSIAADDAASVHTQSATVAQWRQLRGGQPFPSGFGYVTGVGAHMHLVGRRITVTRNGETLLDIPRWSFHWQGQYQYVEPIKVANTDTITIRCEYDNSNTNRLALGLTPNMTVSWGEGTQDEMCLAQLQMVERLP